ncbi:MAG: N-acyl homoserine lactonase family protein, partial [Planctomycetes bacterium]|nr:N-acyl homoserine lactonase family protein [Planctomycetota bacterium]
PYAHQEPHQQMRPALKKAMGWTPEQVDIVINTHLHFDHCCCNYMFTNADIYVQRLELESAYNPPVATAALYAQRGFDKKAVPYFQWKLVDGEMTILPGLIVFPTPGHTYGHQSVLVDTEEGALCVAGDVVALTENINDNIEGSSIVDAAAVYKSFAAIRRRADRIIPGHETSIPDGAENGFPLIA